MAQTVGDFVVARLAEWGVRRIYGYPGDGINGITAALRKAGDNPRFIQARHEEMAAFMACAHAKFTGEVGVCLATCGPGAIHLLNGLYDAKMDHQPVVAIVGQSATTVAGRRLPAGSRPPSTSSRTSPASTASRSTPPPPPGTASTARSASPRTSAPSPASSSPRTCRRNPPSPKPPQMHDMHPHRHRLRRRRTSSPRNEDLRRAADVLNAGNKSRHARRPGALRATDEVIADRRSPRRRRRQGAGWARPSSPTTCPTAPARIGLLGTKPPATT